MIDHLNNLRAANGKAPLKSWKESKAKLEAAIAKEMEMLEAKGIEGFEMSADELAKQAPRAEIKTEKQLAEEIKQTIDDAAERDRIERVKSSAKNVSLKIVKTVDGGKAVVKNEMHADPRPTKEIMKAKRTSSSEHEPFELANVARALGIDPKLARVKARRHLKHLQIHPDAWTFKAKDYDAVVAILKADQRKK
jgi:hypothetical protein